MTQARTGTDWLAVADPSWYPRVLAVLQRDFPDTADMAWAVAISDNAGELNEKYGYTRTARTIAEAAAQPAELTRDAAGEVWPSDDRAAIGATRACPDCGRPQHYTGLEYGWAHDALVDTWHCNDPRKAS